MIFCIYSRREVLDLETTFQALFGPNSPETGSTSFKTRFSANKGAKGLTNTWKYPLKRDACVAQVLIKRTNLSPRSWLTETSHEQVLSCLMLLFARETTSSSISSGIVERGKYTSVPENLACTGDDFLVLTFLTCSTIRRKNEGLLVVYSGD